MQKKQKHKKIFYPYGMIFFIRIILNSYLFFIDDVAESQWSVSMF
jgi:hypothetical protein